jgi:glycerophosphoryl diester phosphodiesterase
MKLVAHRCNTLESFSTAIEYNPDAIEMDVVYFEDNLYLYHPKNNKSLFGTEVDKVIEEELKSENNRLELDLRIIAPKLLEKVSFLLLDLKQKSLDVLPGFLEQVISLNAKPEQILIGSREKIR